MAARSVDARSRRLLFSADARPIGSASQQGEIYGLDRGGTLAALTKRMGPDTTPVVSPNGRSIAYLGYDDVRRGYAPRTLRHEIDGTIALGRRQDRPRFQPVFGVRTAVRLRPL